MKKLKSLLVATVAVATFALASCSGEKSEKAEASENAEKSEKEAVKADALEEGTNVVDYASINIDELTTDYTIFDFNAEWCGPCKQFAPIFDAASLQYPGVTFVSANVDDYPELAAYFGAEAIPMVVVVDRNGNTIAENIGYMDADAFDEFLKESNVK